MSLFQIKIKSIILCVSVFIVAINTSCDNFFDFDPNLDCDVLYDTVALDELNVETLKLLTQVGGYPRFEKVIEKDISIYKVLYRTSYKNEEVIASGLISFPTDRSVAYPVIHVGNGLIFDDDDAPSAFDLPDNYSGFEFMAAKGFVVFVPDMIGFGSSKDMVYPIHNYEISANTMLDFARAGNEFIEEKSIAVTGDVYLTGYSQGAYIALSMLKKMEKDNVSDVNITAAAIGAGGFNLEYLLEYSMEQNMYSAPSHLALLFHSYNAVYDWDKPLNYFFNEKYAKKIPKLLNGKYNREEIDEYLTTKLDRFLQADFFENLKNGDEVEVLNRIRENSIHNCKVTVPLVIMHSENDDRIPIEDSEQTCKLLLENGSPDVTFIPMDASDHINSGFDFIELVFSWLDEMNKEK